ncbi:MAG: ABC transporter ATP-binding protein [Clostridia bacterium]|nr:ABC transporter ATP-binding protein [Clostridia bacterium]
MFPGPPPGARFQYAKITPPKNIADVPRYLRELLGGFFSRMGYVCKLVWKTGPWILFAMLFFAIFQGIMPVVGSKISEAVLNELQSQYGLFGDNFAGFLGSAVFFLLVFMFVYNIITSIVNTIKNTVTRIAGELVVRTVKLEIMNKAKELDLCSFDLPAFYEKLENANREAGMRPIQILSSTFSVVSTVITLISFVVILAAELWWAALVMVAVSVPSAIINFHYRRKHFQYMRRRSKDRRQMSYYSDLMVNKDMAKEIRMFDLADTFIGRYRETFDRYFAGIRSLILREDMWHVIITVVSSVVNCGFYAWFAYRVVTGGYQIGTYSLYTGALGQIAAQVGALITISATIYEGTLFIDNLSSFLKEEPTVVPIVPEERKGEGPLKVAHGQPHTIEFRHVSFIYPGTERKVLDDVSLVIRPGETLVLVGLNGAGKTTLLKLLTRLYDPTEGVILLDGEDIRAYDVKDLYSMYGIIFQDFGKYAVSVSENIHFGDIHKEVKNEEIRKAAEEADATDYIGHLPAGFDTPLMRIFEEEGIELSIGQWQKLAIARAFYSDSDVLILDEPTASLDPMAEQEIFNQFDRLRADKTTIFVSHRLSSATVASKIAVLEYGKLIEEGDHRQLMAKRGRYYELFSTQAKRYVTESEAVLEDVPEELKPHRAPHGMPPQGMPPHGMPPHGMPPQGMPPHGMPPKGAGRRRDE